jgi:hypothetical protein
LALSISVTLLSNALSPVYTCLLSTRFIKFIYFSLLCFIADSFFFRFLLLCFFFFLDSEELLESLELELEEEDEDEEDLAELEELY